jgi:SEC-C motif
MKLGRNDPCHCGSGQKYKKCHLAQDDAARSAELAGQAAERKAIADREAAEEAEKEKAGAESETPGQNPKPRGAAPAEKLAKQKGAGTAAPLFRRRAV